MSDTDRPCGRCREGMGMILEAEEEKCPQCRVQVMGIPKDVRLLVCGGRTYGNLRCDDELHKERCDQYDRLYCAIRDLKPDVIIHGNATGADTIAADFAEDYDIPVLSFPANWNKYGKAAGGIRNAQMLKEGKPTLVLAAPGGNGTANMVRQAREKGIEVFLLDGLDSINEV